jgi:Tol biopolymer transport system component
MMRQDGTSQVLETPTSDQVFDGAQPTRDGQWVYFAASFGYQHTEIWRVRTDGSLTDRVGRSVGVGQDDGQPAPSPDGSRVVFAGRPSASILSSLTLLDVASSTYTAFAMDADRAAWSPIANEVAFIAPTFNGELWIARGDGSGAYALTSGLGAIYRLGQVDWSPDGKWILTCVQEEALSHYALKLIDRTTGEVIPLNWAKRDNLCTATWKSQP